MEQDTQSGEQHAAGRQVWVYGTLDWYAGLGNCAVLHAAARARERQEGRGDAGRGPRDQGSTARQTKWGKQARTNEHAEEHPEGVVLQLEEEVPRHREPAAGTYNKMGGHEAPHLARGPQADAF